VPEARIAAMSRYFFHVLCDGGVYIDEHGEDVSDLKSAKARAAAIARKLREDDGCLGSVCIFDEEGNPLDHVPIRDSVL
jgi:hypothetical protein